MRHGSLFSGIGGFDLAASWMGWENVFQVEWDAWCQRVLAKNFPDTLKFGDIKEFNDKLENGEIITDTECGGFYSTKSASRSYKCRNGQAITEGKGWSETICTTKNFGRIDILSGGFPCQPFSHAGKRNGVADERYLWPEMLRTIRILKPSYVVGENVAGLVSMENGKTLDTILSDLENEGYATEQVIIPACAVGAWHRRDRIWIVAHSLHGTNRTNGGQSRKAESLSCECRQTGQSRESCGTGGEILPNSVSQRGCSRNTGGEYAENAWQLRGSSTDGYWNSKSELGRMVNGIPPFMDEYWDREPEGVPRVATGVKDRVNRLKGLGNAIVPQIAYILYQAIDELNNI